MDSFEQNPPCSPATNPPLQQRVQMAQQNNRELRWQMKECIEAMSERVRIQREENAVCQGQLSQLKKNMEQMLQLVEHHKTGLFAQYSTHQISSKSSNQSTNANSKQTIVAFPPSQQSASNCMSQGTTYNRAHQPIYNCNLENNYNQSLQNNNPDFNHTLQSNYNQIIASDSPSFKKNHAKSQALESNLNQTLITLPSKATLIFENQQQSNLCHDSLVYTHSQFTMKPKESVNKKNYKQSNKPKTCIKLQSKNSHKLKQSNEPKQLINSKASKHKSNLRKKQSEITTIKYHQIGSLQEQSKINQQREQDINYSHLMRNNYQKNKQMKNNIEREFQHKNVCKIEQKIYSNQIINSLKEKQKEEIQKFKRDEFYQELEDCQLKLNSGDYQSYFKKEQEKKLENNNFLQKFKQQVIHLKSNSANLDQIQKQKQIKINENSNNLLFDPRFFLHRSNKDVFQNMNSSRRISNNNLKVQIDSQNNLSSKIMNKSLQRKISNENIQNKILHENAKAQLQEYRQKNKILNVNQNKFFVQQINVNNYQKPNDKEANQQYVKYTKPFSKIVVQSQGNVFQKEQNKMSNNNIEANKRKQPSKLIENDNWNQHHDNNKRNQRQRYDKQPYEQNSRSKEQLFVKIVPWQNTLRSTRSNEQNNNKSYDKIVFTNAKGYQQQRHINNNVMQYPFNQNQKKSLDQQYKNRINVYNNPKPKSSSIYCDQHALKNSISPKSIKGSQYLDLPNTVFQPQMHQRIEKSNFHQNESKRLISDSKNLMKNSSQTIKESSRLKNGIAYYKEYSPKQNTGISYYANQSPRYKKAIVNDKVMKYDIETDYRTFSKDRQRQIYKENPILPFFLKTPMKNSVAKIQKMESKNNYDQGKGRKIEYY